MSEVAASGEPAPADETPEKQSTDYFVFSKDADNDWWIAAGSYTAASAKAAVSTHVKEKDAKAGTFVAVPQRSWRPLTLAVETETKVKLS